MYESPIEKIVSEISTKMTEAEENHLMYTVEQSLGYRVDKDELIKALQYDRDQYSKGYQDAKREMQWTPCSDRPPKEGTEVFVYLFANRPYIAWFEDSRWRTNDFVVDKDDEPNAWYPLPEQYTEHLSAQPENKKGWEHGNTGDWHCSVCGKPAMFVAVSDDHYGIHLHTEQRLTDFCPNCGADMRGEQKRWGIS